MSLPERRSAIVALLVTAAALTGLAPGPSGAAVASPESTYAAAAVRATNNARAENDRRALRVSDCLRGFAVRQAAAMAESGSMYHQDLGPVMDGCGLSTAGENVAYGYPSGRAVVRRGWMHSEGHRANILSREYRLVAVAARRDAGGTWYVAQVFGRRR